MSENGSSVRYPHIEVELIGQDGNAFAIIARVTRAMGQAGLSRKIREEYRQEAMAGDYDHLLRTTMAWVEVV